ncbi:MAG: DUF6894 family protein [Pseudolabrys sp.]
MRYFFHFMAGGARLDDDQGCAYDNPQTARADAVRAAREMIADFLSRNEEIPADGSIEVTDERGQLIDCVGLTEVAFGIAPDSTYRRIFDHTPQATILLAPDLTIIAANRAYLDATMTDIGAIVRRTLFDVFPDNPGDPDASGSRNLEAALAVVMRDKTAAPMAIQRHDLRRADGSWEMRYWKPVNIPILDAQGDIEFIAHQIEDVTGAMTRETSPTP